jgi:pyrroloquinoline quinone (PQQ) biosynthesis protein C
METTLISDPPEMKNSSEKYLGLVQIIKDIGAMENEFFKKCKENALNKEQLVRYLFNWYPITESFAIYGLLYSHNVAKYLQQRIDSVDFKNIASFFCDVLLIAKGEFEIIKMTPNNFHPKAFTRLAPKLSVKSKDLINRQYKLNYETIILEKNIISNFSINGDILAGFANFFVVETIAYDIVKSMESTFGQLKNPDGSSLYNNNEMVYISEHLTLELEHKNEVEKMLDKLNLQGKDLRLLSFYVKELSYSFSNYWSALND